MSHFSPIAIVGRGCVLPGAFSPEELWGHVLAGRDLLGQVPPGYWRVDPSRVLVHPESWVPETTWTDRGGYVRDFARVFDPEGFAVPAATLLELDQQFHWALFAARAALRGTNSSAPERSGLILGNLAYPTFALSEYAESVWRERAGAAPASAEARPHPRNRFHSGLLARVTAEALALGAGAFALDAACASSLYALKLACDRLHDGRADLMLAGAVNRTDDLPLRTGFCALGAMSRTGQSRPFHPEADGLIPSEGAVIVALRRLEDAEALGEPILGVIRGIGLSNDGRRGGFLSPSSAGQVTALREAYRRAGLAPSDVSMVECHATGTPVGDRVELETLRVLFAGCDDVPLSSLKSNLGHLMTVAGAAGLLKILAGFADGVLPPMRTSGAAPEWLAPPFRLVGSPEPWECRGPRRAGLNAFGFGGTNAHMIVEEWTGPATRPGFVPAVAPTSTPAVAVVSLAIRAGGLDTEGFASRLLGGAAAPREPHRRIEEVVLDAQATPFPPRDLGKALPQQLVVLEVVQEAAGRLRLPVESSAVLVGMQCAVEIARVAMRIRLAGRDGTDAGPPVDWLERARQAVSEPLDAAATAGGIPNILANRINVGLDLCGPSFTVADGELSGIQSLELAARALRAMEVDAAVVAAVDLCCEPVHTAASAAVLPPGHRDPGDAAVALVLKRLDDARRDGDPVLAILGGGTSGEEDPLELRLDEGSDGLNGMFGHAHAASGLLLVAAGVLAADRRLRPAPAGSGPWPWVAARPEVAVSVEALGGERATVRLEADREGEPAFSGGPFEDLPEIHVFAGADRSEVLRALRRGEPSDQGQARLALVASGPEEFERLRGLTQEVLGRDGPSASLPPGAYFRDRPIGGRLAFVGGSAVTAYPRMGHELLWAFPEVVRSLLGRHTALPREVASWYDPVAEPAALGPAAKASAALFLVTIQGLFARKVLRLRPEALIGLSSGEQHILFAAGFCAPESLGAMMKNVRDSGFFTRELGGEFLAARRAWGLRPNERVDWSMWRVIAPVGRIREALQGEARAHLGVIQTAEDAVIVGDRAACLRVLDRLGRETTSLEVADYKIMAHAPELLEFEAGFRSSIVPPDRAVPEMPMYSGALGTSYPLTPDRFADAYLAQAVGTVDFPRVIEAAWEDGIRVFVEHGAHDLTTKLIGEILGPREHLAVGLDSRAVSSLRQAAQAAAQLFAAGVDVDHGAFNARIGRMRHKRPGQASPTGHPLRFPAHLPPIALPPRPSTAASPPSQEPTTVEIMAPAPTLAPVLEMALGVAPAELRWEPTARPTAVAAPPPPHSDGPPQYDPSGVIAHAVAIQTRVFRGFLANVHDTHRRFLDVRDRAVALLEGVGQDDPPVSSFDLAGPAWDDPVEPTSALPSSEPRPSPPVEAPSPPARPGACHPGPRGPAFGRDELLRLAGGKVSSVFGPAFERQDGHARQVRLPMPPLLLVDRITGIDAPPGVLGTGTIWTETDVRPGAWYLLDGAMVAGVMIESGQADLTLISWMGADFENKGERVYRLLGCDLAWHAGLPRPGETLCYEIRITGHARRGDVRLFFFQYDCRVDGELRMSVRNGQAGFFTDAELEESSGILLAPETAEPRDDARRDPPRLPSRPCSFDRDRVDAWFQGRAFDCFGPGYELLQAHTRSPRGGSTARGDDPASPRLQFFDEVTVCDADGGPWGRGHLRAVRRIGPDDWFFAGHFHNDPCMPGTLMFEGTLQAMAFYLTWIGFTLERDGWRFEPIPGETYPLRCRGQVVPTSLEMIYELFVEEVHDGDEPRLYADLLVTVDGLKAFHCRRMGLRLVPDWPLSSRPELLEVRTEDRPFAVAGDVRGDHRALLAGALGRPSDAFGSMYLAFDGARRAPRLPAPPYLFLTRITRVEAEARRPEPGAAVEAEYDVPPDAWYFRDHGGRAMPFCVLMEAILQPCGWLATYLGFTLKGEEDLSFRNLDGTGVFEAEVLPGAGTLRTRATLLRHSEFGGMVIVAFEVEAWLGARRVGRLETSFGFFTVDSLARQVGLSSTPEERAALDRPAGPPVDLTGPSPRHFAGPLRLPSGPLRMIDRVTSYKPSGGKAGLGRLVSEQDVDPSAWYFKAHFYQDPVQPGSLGLEAMVQLLQFFMIERGMHEGIEAPVFEPIASGRTITWKYRGQVVPRNARVQVEMEVTDTGRDERGPYAVADAWLWVDGLRIYHALGLAVRILDDAPRGGGEALRTPAGFGLAPIAPADSSFGARS